MQSTNPLSPHTNITVSHMETFNALTSGECTNFALFSCFVDGEPAAAIVAVNFDGEAYDVQPLFVSVTATMTVTDHEGRISLVYHAPETPQPAASMGGSDVATTAEKE
jgi:hypothetical protein